MTNIGRVTHRIGPVLVSALVVAGWGCREDSESPTGPTSSGRPAFATTAGHLVVNSVGDPGDGICTAANCTLREAIKDSRSTEITFAAGLTGPITLARPSAGGGSLVIDKPLTITGPTTRMVIQRKSTDPAFRILRVGSGGDDVRLSNLVLRNGKTDQRGGGIINFGTLALTRTTLAANSAALRGGGIDNHSSLTVTNSLISRNTANEGAGIFNSETFTLRVSGSTIADNLGVGIWNNHGTFTLENSMVARNSQSGIRAWGGTSTLRRVRIVENSGTGIDAFIEGNRATLTRSTVARNGGAGITNRDGSTFDISHSSIVGNRNGGIVNAALGDGRLPVVLTLSNSTISGNFATSGGGIFNRNRSPDEADAVLVITNSTIVRNSASTEGGGIDLIGGRLTLTNSLVAQNTSPSGPDIFRGGQVLSVLARFNLIGDGTGSGISNADGNQVGSTGAPIDPMIGGLTNNGGPTTTHALLVGSPAIDAASDDDCPTDDQRGVSRPQGPHCDIGSYERE